MGPELYYVIFSLVAVSFFSGMEIAFVSSNKLQIELLNKQGSSSGRILSKFLKNASRYIGTTMLCNTLAIVLYDIYMTEILEPHIHAVLGPNFHNEIAILLIHSVIATIIILVIAEFIPKTIFMANPNVMLEVFALPMNFIYYIMWIFVFIVMWPTRYFIENVLRAEFSEEKPVFGLTDLNNYIGNQSPDPNDDQEKAEVDAKIFSNALEFKKTRVKDCMRPRTEIIAIEITDGIEELKNVFLESGHSKILVYKETIDEIIGYVHTLAMFKKPASIEEVLTPILVIPEIMPANDLMIQFIDQRKSLAVVVDEFGGTAGIVSIEDIMEEIFGEINDEHDEDELPVQKIDTNTYSLSARLEIDNLNEKFNWNLPVGDYDTIGGFIISEIEDLPSIGQVIDIPPFTFTIESMDENKIDKIKVQIAAGKNLTKDDQHNFGH